MIPVVLKRVALPFALSALAACNNNGGDCVGTANTAAQTGNTLYLSGNFQNGQPVMTLTKDGKANVIAATTNTVDVAEFDITGLPKGVYTATWEMSCYDDSGTHAFGTNHVPTVTIQ